MIQNGISKSQEITHHALTNEWRNFFETTAISRYQKWCSLPRMDRCKALEQHKADIDQKNQILEVQQRTLSQFKASSLPYDLSEKP